MGFSLMFSEESNFKNLLSPNGLSSSIPFSDVWLKACLEVHESGSEPSKVEGLYRILVKIFKFELLFQKEICNLVLEGIMSTKVTHLRLGCKAGGFAIP